jgi:hypothetical protein
MYVMVYSHEPAEDFISRVTNILNITVRCGLLPPKFLRKVPPGYSYQNMSRAQTGHDSDGNKLRSNFCRHLVGECVSVSGCMLF